MFSLIVSAVRPTFQVENGVDQRGPSEVLKCFHRGSSDRPRWRNLFVVLLSGSEPSGLIIIRLVDSQLGLLGLFC